MKVERKEELFQQRVIICVRADPEPNQIAVAFHGERPVTQSDPDGPIAAGPLKTQRWMLRVFLEQGVILVGQRPNVFGKPGIGRPERRAGEMPYSSRARPWS
jgi:hypothetical protein